MSLIVFSSLSGSPKEFRFLPLRHQSLSYHFVGLRQADETMKASSAKTHISYFYQLEN